MSDPELAERVAEIVRAGRFVDARGWTPATSGNLSVRIDDARIAITESGAAKGALEPSHILVADRRGVTDPQARRPSAETALHWEAYERDPAIGAVVHTHARTATVLSRHVAPGTSVVLEGYELLKAFAGITTHAARLEVPVLDNDQDMAALARAARLAVAPLSAAYGYLIRGHGLYAWGRDMTEALRHVEAFEFLFSCYLDERGRSPR